MFKAGEASHRPGELVFGTSSRLPDTRQNVNKRLKRAATRANVVLAHRSCPPIGDLSPHSLRRTFASLLYLRGENPVYVMHQLGHTDPKLALRIHARVIGDKRNRGRRLGGVLAGPTWSESARRRCFAWARHSRRPHAQLDLACAEPALLRAAASGTSSGTGGSPSGLGRAEISSPSSCQYASRIARCSTTRFASAKNARAGGGGLNSWVVCATATRHLPTFGPTRSLSSLVRLWAYALMLCFLAARDGPGRCGPREERDEIL